MSSCIHGRDVSFGSECWECEQEKRRHKETLELQKQALEDQQHANAQLQRQHQELLDAQEHQQELLREAAYSQEEAARAQREQLTLQRKQIEEAKARQQAEEERRELRTGLPEFSEEYRRSWLAVSETQEALEAKITTRRVELARSEHTEQSSARSVKELWAQIHSDLATEFQVKVEQGTAVLEDPPPTLSDETSRRELAELSASLQSVGIKIGASKAKIFPADGPLVRLYRELSVFAERLRSLAQSPPKAPLKAIGCMAFLLGCAIFGVVMAIRQPEAPIGGAVVFYLLAASIPALLIVRRYSLIRQVATAYSPSQNCMKAITSLLAKVPGVEPKAIIDPIVSPQQSRENQLKSIAATVATTRSATILALVEMYKMSNYSSHGMAHRLGELNAEWNSNIRDVAEATRRLECSPEEAAMVATFRTMREEIRKVGRLILDGRRIPGVCIELVRCQACDGITNSETRKCPYCGEGIPL